MSGVALGIGTWGLVTGVAMVKSGLDPWLAVLMSAGMSLAQMALAFPLAHPGVTAVNFGVRNLRQFNDAKAGFGNRLTDDVLDAIDACNPPGSIVDEADRGWIMPWMAPEARRRLHSRAVA